MISSVKQFFQKFSSLFFKSFSDPSNHPKLFWPRFVLFPTLPSQRPQGDQEALFPAPARSSLCPELFPHTEKFNEELFFPQALLKSYCWYLEIAFPVLLILNFGIFRILLIYAKKTCQLILLSLFLSCNTLSKLPLTDSTY